MRTIIGSLIIAFLIASCGGHPTRPIDLTIKKTPKSTASENATKLVQVVYYWQLFDKTTFDALRPEYTTVKDPVTKKEYNSALYIRNAQGKIEPYLVINRGHEPGKPPLVSRGSCTGFIISNNGFILTSSVASEGWNSCYNFTDTSFPGSLVSIENGKQKITPGVVRKEDLVGWKAADATMINVKNITPGQIIGKLYGIDIFFSGSPFHKYAVVSKTLSDHGIAIIKVDVPEVLDTLAMKDNFNEVQAGAAVIVPGYAPPSTIVSGHFYTLVNKASIPRISIGNINQAIAASPGKIFNSVFGDVFTLSMNSTDDCMDGAPVFDDNGNVIGVYNHGQDEKGNKIPFVIPIKYAIGLKGK